MNTFLLAEVNPQPKAYFPSDDLLSEPSSKSCQYMRAFALQYNLGADVTRFRIEFGNIVMEDREVFRPILYKEIPLTKTELSTWGENDESCYNLIAEKLGLNCISFRTMAL